MAHPIGTFSTVGTVGIKALKNRASQIVQEVREARAVYVVTLRGEPVAEIRPLPPRESPEPRQDVDQLLAEIDELARRIGSSWRSPVSAAEAIGEQRR